MHGVRIRMCVLVIRKLLPFSLSSVDYNPPDFVCFMARSSFLPLVSASVDEATKLFFIINCTILYLLYV